MFRLLSTYSLVKPQRGSNISDGEMLETLLNIEDISDSKERKEKLENALNVILDKGECQEIPAVVTVIHDHDCSVSDTLF